MRTPPVAVALSIGLAFAAVSPAAAPAAAPENLQPPHLESWAGESSSADCDGGKWGGTPVEFTYEWVLDPGASEVVLHTDGPTGAGAVSFTALPANVNHVLACRVTATNGEGSTGPVYAEGNGPFPQSALVAPLVSFEVNGATISGDVGGSLNGANAVTVSLRRDNACQYCESGPGPRVVQSASGTIENSSGQWSVTLPTRAVGDSRDLLFLDFSGAGAVEGSTASSGVPPDTTVSLHDDPFFFDARGGPMTAMRVWPDPGGSEVVVSDKRCNGDFVCSKAVVHAPGHGGDIVATLEPFDGLGGAFVAPLTGTATNDDPIGASLWMTRFTDPQPTLLELTKTAPMLGVYVDPSELLASSEEGEEEQVFEARLAPKCFAFYAEGSIEGFPASAYCIDVAPETHYALVHSRGAPLHTYPFETEAGQTGFGVPLLDALAPGDVVALELAAPSGSRELAQTTVGSFRVDLREDSDLLGGECTPGRWLMLSGTVLCPPSGVLDPAEFDPEIDQFERPWFANELGSIVTLEDDRGGGGTAIHVPAAVQTVPMDGESVWGSSWQAFANVSDAAFSWAGGGTPTQLAYQTWVDPLTDGPWTIVPGNPNTVQGTTVGGVSPGRYQARWRVTDAHANTNTHYTMFFQQPALAGPQGPAGANGAQGAAGAAGATGPAGPPGRDAKVTCTVKKPKKSKVKVTCKVKLVSSSASASRVREVGVRLWRASRLYAIGSAPVRNGRATVPMRELHTVRRGGRYDVRVVAQVPEERSTRSTARVTVR